jgi:hypothetical protein
MMYISRLAYIRRHARRLIAPVFILIITGLAWMLSAGSNPWWLTAVRWLGQYELFHITAHFVIFSGLVLLLGSRSQARIWTFTLGGGLLLEIAQMAAGGIPLSLHHMSAVVFDLGIDMLGAVAGLMIVRARTAT